jgi:hypothetical protein
MIGSIGTGDLKVIWRFPVRRAQPASRVIERNDQRSSPHFLRPKQRPHCDTHFAIRFDPCPVCQTRTNWFFIAWMDVFRIAGVNRDGHANVSRDTTAQRDRYLCPG